MAHKHNRRRIRPRHNRHHAPSTAPTTTSDLFLPDLIDSPALATVISQLGSRPRSSSCSTVVPALSMHARLSDLTAQHWHNRYISWQIRERQARQQRELEAAKLEADQCRLFGGEPGDDASDKLHDRDVRFDDELLETAPNKAGDEGRGGYNSVSCTGNM